MTTKKALAIKFYKSNEKIQTLHNQIKLNIKYLHVKKGKKYFSKINIDNIHAFNITLKFCRA